MWNYVSRATACFHFALSGVLMQFVGTSNHYIMSEDTCCDYLEGIMLIGDKIVIIKSLPLHHFYVVIQITLKI